ncbi:leukocyte tyrosine kinase receptor-like isoform X2 [Planococcus citri]|uniref:leukocyte tyrosine kinase receptor-like isoform X2 n=1 Tax=Planococcus citri TaxID=170843 RepID=UPI0031F98B1B
MRKSDVKVYGYLVLLIASCLPSARANNDLNSYVRLLNGFPNVTCNFESPCTWTWAERALSNSTALHFHEHLIGYNTPLIDADNRSEGHFLLIFDTNERNTEFNLTSIEINPAYFDKNVNEICTLSFAMHTNAAHMGNISILIQEGNRTKVIANHINTEDELWNFRKINLGHPEEKFRIIIEVGSNRLVKTDKNKNSHVAIDNIQLEHCFPDVTEGECPPDKKFRCMKESVCIPLNFVCDIKRDCSDAADEKQNCDKVPAGTRCTFENGWCGWRNTTDKHHTLRWKLNRGPTKNKHTGPTHDNTFANENGTYAYVDMSYGTLGSLALMESVPINPPPPVHGDSHSPHYNSCYVSFFYHKFGPHSGSLALYLREDKYDTPRSSFRLWWSYGNKGDNWLRQVVILPNITERYTLQFEARKAMSSRGDVAIDDISFSPKCFGIGIPQKDLNGYDYWEYPKKNSESIHPSFANKPVYSFTTCGQSGSHGPTSENCEKSYKNTTSKVEVLDSLSMKGFQKWVVPDVSYYTIIAKGARGGKGADALGESRAAMVRAVTELYKGQSIYFLIGQEGHDACRKLTFDTPSCIVDLHLRTTSNFKSILRDQKLYDGGGGGGGATYIFTMEKGSELEPLLVAAGGGGLAHGPSRDVGIQHGKGLNITLPNTTAPSFGNYPAGAGGGWKPGNFTVYNTTGSSLLEGGVGGFSCYFSSDHLKGIGGFGGGGGGCVAGGGGGGYTGGRAWSESSANGEGGSSMVAGYVQYKDVKGGAHYGPGNIIIIPAVSGCGCEYRCIALDEAMTTVKCICPPGWHLSQDNRACVLLNAPAFVSSEMWIFLCALVVASLLLITFSILMYNRYLQQQSELTQRKVCGLGGLQLNHLNPPGPTSVRLTEFNPNYEFGGVTYTIRDLKEIPREKVQLVKPLGCGAFGDVYQGLLRNRDTDSVDLAVAVKILPALSSNQAEADFLMEALIMSKFNHPNIVHFIGACFDTHPRYIILELLAGGDLKNFLRENRPKADKPSALTMKDLLQCAIDVAKGCQYLEELRFIHRDIAARNCLLTSRGPGRVVKIADFGMSRDIYRSDYYKKGGKAMLPIKWMPPEAFLDGIFSSKTDVWSFGVLLWEVMSLGYMPYTGIRNREVMMSVARGGRLGPPANCPDPVYALMLSCWNHDPEQRPTFGSIVERLGYCIQDPNVINMHLPVYKGPLPSELDKTLMRPLESEDEYLQTDYMIPIMPETPAEWKDGRYVIEDRSTIPTPMDLTNNQANQLPNSNNSSTPNTNSTNTPTQKIISNTPNAKINVGNSLTPKNNPNNTPTFKGNSINTPTPKSNNLQNQTLSNSINEDSPKLDENRSKPFILSGQYVKDPQIN